MSTGPVNKHQNLAQGHDPYAGMESSSGTGDTRPNDAHVGEAGKGHVHETDPAKEGPTSHGHHGHEHVHHHHPKGHHGGHKEMEHFHPEGHSGGHKKGNY